MIKNWKSLFVKNDEVNPSPKTYTNDSPSFPVQNQPGFNTSNAPPAATPADPVVNEVLSIYENGLESINMPGFDFYEFYQTVTSTGNPGEQTYKMAFQMAKTLDKTITPGKLLSDAEFYISKINEVHGQYVSQGQQKLHVIQDKKNTEKKTLQQEIDQASLRSSQLKAELQQLESEINHKRNTLSKVEEGYYPQEKTIKEKLSANDLARKTSIDKLNMIKEGIQKYMKD